MKKIIQAALALGLIIFALAACSSPASAPPAAAGPQVKLAAPEDAVAAYLDGVAKSDPARILQACAINEMGEKFKFDLFVDRLGGYMNFIQGLSPADNSFYIEINKANITSQILNQAKNLTYSLLTTEKMDPAAVPTADAARVQRFLKEADPKRLSSLEVKKISFPSKTLATNTKTQENLAKLAKIYGADEATERVALFTFEKNYYSVGFSLLRYGDGWKISTQSSAMSGLAGFGAAQKTTPEEFEKMISQ